MGASQLINKNISVIKTDEGGKDNDSLSLPREYKQESSSNNSKPIQISNRNDQDSLSIRSVTRPSTSRAMILVEDDDEEQDVNNQEPFIPVFDWPASNIPCEPLFGTTLEGNETLCKIRFCNMLTTAYQQYQQRRNDCPQQMCILFDKKDNIKGISIILQNGSREDYLEFEG
jgi:hypothetical protein